MTETIKKTKFAAVAMPAAYRIPTNCQSIENTHMCTHSGGTHHWNTAYCPALLQSPELVFLYHHYTTSGRRRYIVQRHHSDDRIWRRSGYTCGSDVNLLGAKHSTAHRRSSLRHQWFLECSLWCLSMGGRPPAALALLQARDRMPAHKCVSCSASCFFSVAE